MPAARRWVLFGVAAALIGGGVWWIQRSPEPPRAPPSAVPAPEPSAARGILRGRSARGP